MLYSVLNAQLIVFSASIAAVSPFPLDSDETPLTDRIGPWLVERSSDVERLGVPVICKISQGRVRLTFYGGAIAQVELDRPSANGMDDIGTNASVRAVRVDRRLIRIMHRRNIPPAPNDDRPYINDPVTITTFSVDGREERDLLELPSIWREARRLAVLGAHGRRIASINLERFTEAAGTCGY
jgi:hypothetical protein